MNDSLGDRMKGYEAPYKALLPRRTYTVVRVDGRSFHTFLKSAEKPFDKGVARAMDYTAVALCKEISGSVFAYVQSDEISILVTDFAKLSSEPWFNGGVQKIASVVASVATARFNRYFDSGTEASGMATFDARVFAIPQQFEVANYFVWRQQDAVRNAVSMAAAANFPHARRQGKSGNQLQEMLFQEKGINFNDYSPRFKRGGVVTCEETYEDVTYTDKRTKEPVTVEGVFRSRWTPGDAPHFSVAAGGFLANQIPGYAKDEELISHTTLLEQEEVFRALHGEVPMRTVEES